MDRMGDRSPQFPHDALSASCHFLAHLLIHAGYALVPQSTTGTRIVRRGSNVAKQYARCQGCLS